MMAWTAQVAVASILVRGAVGPLAPESRTFPWVALTLVVAVGLVYPVGRAITAAVLPRDIPDGRRCPRCEWAELRPLRMRGRGLFEPVQRYRCGACWTSFELAGKSLVEVGQPEAIEPSEIRYLEHPGAGSIDESGIEFLGVVGPPSRTSAARSCPEGVRSGVEDRGAARR